MSKITRYNGNVVPFANNAQAGERFVFGSSTEQSNDLTTLVSANYLRGWGVVGPSDFPPLEWFNAQAFTSTQFIAYLHQMGIAEWNEEQEYHENSAVNRNGVLYYCKTNNHVSATPPESDPTNWRKKSATDVSYDNTASGLTATDVQGAIDEVEGRVDEVERANKSITINFATDADLTLTDEQNKYGRIELTDTGVVLTTDRSLIVNLNERSFLIVNNTLQDLKVKTVSGTGFTVQSGFSANLRCDGVNVYTGVGCEEVILAVGIYTSGTYMYPYGRNQNNYSKMQMSGGRTSPASQVRGYSEALGSYIKAYPTSWAVLLVGSDDVNRYQSLVSYASETSFTITQEGATSAVHTITGVLKEGVTS